jgi:hypothetical protein
MVGVAKRLRHWFVVPAFAGSNPVIHLFDKDGLSSKLRRLSSLELLYKWSIT